MAKRRVPKGQLNEKRVNLKRFNTFMKDMGKKFSIRVGIIGQAAYEKHPHADLTNANLGAIHEFGATINVTPKMKGWFWYNEGIHKSNKPIVIPARSFLRMPLLGKDGKKELRKAVNSELSTDRDVNKLIGMADSKFLKTIAELVGLRALQRVQEAFETGGFGSWAPISDLTKKLRRGAPDNPPLDDTGSLKDSITFEVKELK